MIRNSINYYFVNFYKNKSIICWDIVKMHKWIQFTVSVYNLCYIVVSNNFGNLLVYTIQNYISFYAMYEDKNFIFNIKGFYQVF